MRGPPARPPALTPAGVAGAEGQTHSGLWPPHEAQGGGSGRRFGPILEYRCDVTRLNGVTGQLPRFGGRGRVTEGPQRSLVQCSALRRKQGLEDGFSSQLVAKLDKRSLGGATRHPPRSHRSPRARHLPPRTGCRRRSGDQGQTQPLPPEARQGTVAWLEPTPLHERSKASALPGRQHLGHEERVSRCRPVQHLRVDGRPGRKDLHG